MKKHCDFSAGVRGKFHRPDVTLNLPVYLDAETRVFVDRIAKKRKADLSAVVNAMLRSSMQLAESMK